MTGKTQKLNFCCRSKAAQQVSCVTFSPESSRFLSLSFRLSAFCVNVLSLLLWFFSLSLLISYFSHFLCPPSAFSLALDVFLLCGVYLGFFVTLKHYIPCRYAFWIIWEIMLPAVIQCFVVKGLISFSSVHCAITQVISLWKWLSNPLNSWFSIPFIFRDERSKIIGINGL